MRPASSPWARRACGLFGFLIVSLPALAEGPPAAVPAANDGGSLHICLATAADYSPVFPATELPPAREMDSVFRLGKDEKFHTLSSEWIAVDVGNAAPPNTSIAKADLDVRSSTAGQFKLSGLVNPMPQGKYRLDVSADGKPWRSAEFSVIAPLVPAIPKNPQEMMPLAVGTVWTYAFVQEAGGGAKVDGEDLKPDADGKLRAKVTLTVEAQDAIGAHTVLRRNDKQRFEEWFTLDDKGLASIQRKTLDQTLIKLDPPQVMWPLPGGPGLWNYEPADKSYRQSWRVWGPLTVQTPRGPMPGYVVLIDQPDGLTRTTVQREYVVGMGMTHELMVTALRWEMLSRQEMILTGVKP